MRRSRDAPRAQDGDEEQTKTVVILTRKVDSGGAMTTRRTRKTSPKIEPIDELQRLLGHRFTRPELLALALTHRSHTYEARHGVPTVILPAHPDQRDQRNPPGTDNEQLEFLGDSILGLVVTEALYREFPQSSEGELTRLRSILVSRARMAEVGVALELGEQLFLGKSADQNGGRKKPALLANAVEAIIAAVYLDAGAKGLKAVRAIVERYVLEPDLDTMRAALAGEEGRGALRDHKTVLQERVQASGLGRLRYVDTDQTGPAHQRRFSVEAQLEGEAGTRTLAAAEGSNKKEAQQRAAELALAQWEANGLPPRPVKPPKGDA
ncbi:ribonuclease III [Granulicella mallensis]|nr:ribonuclease III [Granulicella mallensis]